MQLTKTETRKFGLSYLTFVSMPRVKDPDKEMGSYANLCGSSVIWSYAHLRPDSEIDEKLKTLCDETIEMIVDSCDEKGYLKVTKKLRKQVYKYRKNMLDATEEGYTERGLFLRLITYQPFAELKDYPLNKPGSLLDPKFHQELVNISFREYIKLGKPEVISQKITKTIRPSKNEFANQYLLKKKLLAKK